MYIILNRKKDFLMQSCIIFNNYFHNDKMALFWVMALLEWTVPFPAHNSHRTMLSQDTCRNIKHFD